MTGVRPHTDYESRLDWWRHRIEALAYVRVLLITLSSAEVDLESLPPSV